MPDSRIYLVKHVPASGPGSLRLVRAPNQAQAIRHVTRREFSAEVASQNDLFDLATKGHKVEDSAIEPEAEG